MTTIFIGQKGVKLKTILNIPVSNADILRLYYKSPSGQTGYWDCTLGDGPNIIEYVNTAGFNEAGRWRFQPYVKIGDNEYWGSIWSQFISNTLINE